VFIAVLPALRKEQPWKLHQEPEGGLGYGAQGQYRGMD